MKAISKNVYFDVLDEIVNKYDKIIQRKIKMKPIDVTSDSHAEYNYWWFSINFYINCS